MQTSECVHKTSKITVNETVVGVFVQGKVTIDCVNCCAVDHYKDCFPNLKLRFRMRIIGIFYLFGLRGSSARVFLCA